MASTEDIPAILGGRPLFPEGPPDWPPVDEAVADVLRRAAADRSWGRYHGPACERLARLMSERHGLEFVHLCCSGTAAVELALRGLSVGPGDEVILAAYDFKGNFQDVLAIGATPVLVDVRAEDWQLDVARVEAALTGRTKAVIASHLHGGLVDMPALADVARPRGVAVLEDACQCPGALVFGRPAGGWGDAAVFSFGGSKLLSAGRGGAVVTANADVAQRIRLFTQRGNDAYPLSELQAALLIPQWERLDERNAARARAARMLRDAWSIQSGLAALAPIGNDSSSAAVSPAFYKLGLKYDAAAFGGIARDLFSRALRAEGVALDAGFRALHLIHSRRRFRSEGDLANATAADAAALTLHHPVLLGEPADGVRIVAAVERLRRFADQVNGAAPSSDTNPE